MTYSLKMKIPTYYKTRYYETDEFGEITVTADTYQEICDQANVILTSQNCINEIVSEISTLQVNKQQLINSIAHLKGQHQQALDQVNTFKAWLKAVGIDPNRSSTSISLQALLDHSDPSLFELEPASTSDVDVILPEF